MARKFSFHYPSLVLVFGLILFYSQVAFHWWRPEWWHQASGWLFAAFALVVLGVGFIFFTYHLLDFFSSTRKEFSNSSRLFWCLCLCVIFLLACMFFSALKPAYHLREGDFIDYHLFLPKQHWIRGNWKPIDSHRQEYMLLAVDYALSWFWIALPLLNRLPQFLIQCFLILKTALFFTVIPLGSPTKRYRAGLVTVTAFLSFHAVILQLGMAMLDLVNFYFLLSSILTFFLLQRSPKSKLLSFFLGIDLGFYFVHKSFGLFYFFIIISCCFIIYASVQNLGTEAPKTTWNRGFKLGTEAFRNVRWIWFLTPIAMILIPNAMRSLHYTNDPFYPIFSHALNLPCHGTALVTRTCDEMRHVASSMVRVARELGFERTLDGLVKAFFLGPLPRIPFQREGFFFGTNELDYPLGIFWFVTWLTLALAWIRGWLSRDLARFFVIFCVVLFLFWFLTSQQGRWLYPVMFTLSLSWALALDYLLAQPNRKTKHFACILPITSTLFVFFGAIKIIASDGKHWSCTGHSCLQYGKYRLLDQDFQAKCTDQPLIIKGRDCLGYFPCPAEPSFDDLTWKK